MPKEKASGTSVPRRSRSRPYRPKGKGSEGVCSDASHGKKDWEDSLCPICLEPPHNAVLLICTSHADGCRPYMCNTSHRHSNCLDQYQKTQFRSEEPQNPHVNSDERLQPAVADPLVSGEVSNLRMVGATSSQVGTRQSRTSTDAVSHSIEDTSLESALIEALNSRMIYGDSAVATRRLRRNSSTHMPERHEPEPILDLETASEVEGMDEEPHLEGPHRGSSLRSKHMVCPLCRGQISGWRVINAARKHLNDKARSCSQEFCSFAGTYQELRVHARCEHPFARPCDVDPARQRAWMRMERQREIEDVLSSIGASAGEGMDGEERHLWSYLFLFHFFSPRASAVNEEIVITRIQEQQQAQPPRRGGSARLRELVGNVQRGTDATTSGASTIALEEQTTRTSQQRQLRSQHRRQGDVI